MVVQHLLEVLIRLKDDISGGLKKIQERIKETTKDFSNLENVVKTAGEALMTYGGMRMIGSFIEATKKANQQVALANYMLALQKKSLGDILPKVQQLSKETIKLGFSTNDIIVPYTRLYVKLKDVEKARQAVITGIFLERMNVISLDYWSRIFMGTVEDMRRALLFLARTLGLDLDEAMMDTAEILKILYEGAKKIDLSPLGVQVEEFKARWQDIKEKIGVPFLEAINMIFRGINFLLDRVPILNDIIGGITTMLTTGLAGRGIGLALAKILSFFGITLRAAGPWGAAIGAIIGGVAFAFVKLKEILEARGYEASLSGLFQFLRDKLVELKANLLAEWEKLKVDLVILWELLKSNIVKITGSLYSSLKEKFVEMKAKLLEEWEGFKVNFRTMLELLKSNIEEIAGSLYTFFTQKLPYALGYAMGVIYAFASELPGKIWDSIKTIPDKFVELLNLIYATIKENIPVIIEAIQGLLGAIYLFFMQLKEKIWNFVKTIPDKFVELWNLVKAKAEEYVPIIIETIINLFKELPHKVNEILTGVYNSITNFFENIISKAQEAITTIKNIGTTITSSLRAGFSAGIQALKGAKQLGGYVTETGAYLLHEGEYVIPRYRMAYAGIGNYTFNIEVNITGNTFMSDEETALKIGNMIVNVLRRNIKL